ncbi:DUF6152 family protein [Streptomyces sp. NPDC057002]|uniref:DUF6152 family protein n=1 Tax=Streptomyces sp. NPDC057002 TaxID=3345992 RepID=UPI0036327BEB
MSKPRMLSRAGLVAGMCGIALSVLAVPQASAHHGWSEFDTTRAYYLSGELTNVRWGSPHVEVTIQVEKTAVPQGWADREIPQDVEAMGTRDTMKATRPYDGGRKELHLVLAPPETLRGWGFDRRLEAGETLEAVGFLSRDHDDELRPELIFLENGQAVRQRLLSLPDKPVPPGASGESATGSGGDGRQGSSATGQAADSGSSSAVVWTVTGAVAVLVVAGGAVYVRRRSTEQ